MIFFFLPNSFLLMQLPMKRSLFVTKHRMIEVGRAALNSLFPDPCWRRVSYSMLPKPASQLLNFPRDLNSTASLNLFQCSNPFKVKMLYLTFRSIFLWLYLCWCWSAMDNQACSRIKYIQKTFKWLWFQVFFCNDDEFGLYLTIFIKCSITLLEVPSANNFPWCNPDVLSRLFCTNALLINQYINR